MKNILFVLMFALMATSASALVDVTYNFNQNNAIVEAYNCLDSTCTTVAPFSGSFPNGNSTVTGSVVVRFPSTLVSPNGYALYYFSQGFIPQGYEATWHSFGDPRIFTTNFNINFDKVSTCRSVIDEFTVVNDVQANVPLVINISASLDATTHSTFALTNAPVKYIPPAYRNEYFSADTRVTLKILDSNGNTVNQQAIDYTNANGNPIFADSSARTQFTWIPAVTGRYTATVSTEVIDNQCANAEQMSSQKEFNVLPGMPRNQCYTLLNNLQMDDIRPIQGGQVIASFDKISNHANNFAFNDPSYLLTPIPTQATYTVTDQNNNVVFSQTTGLAANPDNFNPTAQQFAWTPQTTGRHQVTVSGVGNSPLCNGLSNPTEVVTTDIFVQEPPRFNATFQVRDSATGLPVIGATITVGNSQAQTDVSGTAMLGPFDPGTYNFLATRAGYDSKQDSFTITDFNLNVFITMNPRQDPNGFRVNVTVLDDQTAQPIANAQVQLDGFTANTNANGLASFANMANGQYPLRVTAPGYLQQNSIVTVNNQDLNVVIRLQNIQQLMLNATVQLTDRITGVAVPAATVTIDLLNAVSNANGQAALGPFAPGTYALTVTHPGYFTAFGTVTFTNSNLLLQITLDPRINPGQRSATVLVLDDATSQPINNAKVIIDGSQTFTNSTGLAQLNNFVDTTYGFQVEAAGYNTFTSTLTFNGQDLFVTVRLGRQAVEQDLKAELTFSQIRIHDAFAEHAGQQVPVFVTFRNTGEKDLENVKLAVVIQDFAARASFGPVDMKVDKTVNGRMLVDLPEDVKPGLYPVRITLYSLDKQRAVYRDIEVVE